MAIIHFLLVYNFKLQRLVHTEEFSDSDEATAAYSTWETENRANENLEIVLVGADSLEAIKQTHGHYFDGAAPAAASQFLTGV